MNVYETLYKLALSKVLELEGRQNAQRDDKTIEIIASEIAGKLTDELYTMAVKL